MDHGEGASAPPIWWLAVRVLVTVAVLTPTCTCVFARMVPSASASTMQLFMFGTTPGSQPHSVGPMLRGWRWGGRNDNTNPKGIDDGIKIKDQKDAVVRPEVPGCRLPVPTESPNPVRSFFFFLRGARSGASPRSQEDFHADQRLSCGFWRERSRNKPCLVNEQ